MPEKLTPSVAQTFGSVGDKLWDRVPENELPKDFTPFLISCNALRIKRVANQGCGIEIEAESCSGLRNIAGWEVLFLITHYETTA
jgi:hypothetical protein